MRIREFLGVDFEPAARMVGSTWHKEQGNHAYWQGADELCSYLSRSDKGFVAYGEVTNKNAAQDDEVLLGIMLVASPCEDDHNKDLRMHWLQQRTSVAAMANVLGINARADAALLNEERELLERAGSELGAHDVGEIVLLLVSEQARGRGVGRALLGEGVSWLGDHGSKRIRLVTDDGCDWQVYEHLGMERVLQAQADSNGSEDGANCLNMYVYEAREEVLAQRLGRESTAPQYELCLSDASDNDMVGNLLNEHAAQAGVPFAEYNFHIKKDGRTVAGIVAWALGSDVHIDMLAVDEAERRRGLGLQLLEHVEEQARRDGRTTVSVDTFSFQAPDYYPAHGYEVIYRYPLDDGSERIYFSKRL